MCLVKLGTTTNKKLKSKITSPGEGLVKYTTAHAIKVGKQTPTQNRHSRYSVEPFIGYTSWSSLRFLTREPPFFDTGHEAQIMPEKDPTLWVSLFAWLGTIAAALYAPGLSVAIAVLRVVYGNGGRRQMLIEGSLCGLCTLSLVPLLEWLGLPSSMATFAGGAVGFLGVDKLRMYADRFLEMKVGK
jgi:lambda family phage holin